MAHIILSMCCCCSKTASIRTLSGSNRTWASASRLTVFMDQSGKESLGDVFLDSEHHEVGVAFVRPDVAEDLVDSFFRSFENLIEKPARRDQIHR